MSKWRSPGEGQSHTVTGGATTGSPGLSPSLGSRLVSNSIRTGSRAGLDPNSERSNSNRPAQRFSLTFPLCYGMARRSKSASAMTRRSRLFGRSSSPGSSNLTRPKTGRSRLLFAMRARIVTKNSHLSDSRGQVALREMRTSRAASNAGHGAGLQTSNVASSSSQHSSMRQATRRSHCRRLRTSKIWGAQRLSLTSSRGRAVQPRHLLR